MHAVHVYLSSAELQEYIGRITRSSGQPRSRLLSQTATQAWWQEHELAARAWIIIARFPGSRGFECIHRWLGCIQMWSCSSLSAPAGTVCHTAYGKISDGDARWLECVMKVYRYFAIGAGDQAHGGEGAAQCLTRQLQ